MDYFNIFTASCIFSIVAFVAVVFYENYKYKKECKEWLKKGDYDENH